MNQIKKKIRGETIAERDRLFANCLTYILQESDCDLRQIIEEVIGNYELSFSIVKVSEDGLLEVEVN